MCLQAIGQKTYEYGDSTFRDRLTSYNGQQITYDAAGNPLNYRGNALTWSGRTMTSFGPHAYTYDMNGMRLSKNVGGTVTEYVYLGGKLIRETKGPYTIEYVYDNAGIVGLKINGRTFYYIRNYSGDVTALLTETAIR